MQIRHGLAESLSSWRASRRSSARVVEFCRGLVSHYVLDERRLVVAHAGLKEAYQGRASGRVRSFALYGETTGETDEYGLPVRYPWAEDYRGPAMVLYGHTPVPEPEWVNNTLCLDTGCVFGGGSPLCATRSGRSSRCRPSGSGTSRRKPLGPAPRLRRAIRACSTSATCSGKRVIETRLMGDRSGAGGERGRRRWR